MASAFIRRAAAVAAALSATHFAVVARGEDGSAGDAGGGSIDIPFEKYQLDNGLTVILHQDSALPMVAVNILYRVGSRHEESGRTGFAHLFEHLMFMGTNRVPTGMFDAWMEGEGGHNNAWTSNDRTDYYDVAPAHALPLLLWMEADRFSSLADDMDQEKLDAQRDVVRNERRQTSENEPYGKLHLRLPELMYPKGHPYHHPVIGSHEHLQAATVDDVKGFFRKWYAPSNASLVVAGDFDKAEAKALIEKYFGFIPSREVKQPEPVPAPKLTGVVRETIEDKVQLSKVLMAWHSPGLYAPGDAELDLLGSMLDDGKSSRLYKALIYDEPLAQSVSVYQASQDLSSYFVVEAIARPDVPLSKIEEVIDRELAKIAEEPVTDEELSRAKNQYETSYVARLQSLSSRASLLNQYESSVGDPGFAGEDLGRYQSATADGIRDIAKATLDPNARVIVHVVPKEGDEGASEPQ